MDNQVSKEHMKGERIRMSGGSTILIIMVHVIANIRIH